MAEKRSMPPADGDKIVLILQYASACKIIEELDSRVARVTAERDEALEQAPSVFAELWGVKRGDVVHVHRYGEEGQPHVIADVKAKEVLACEQGAHGTFGIGDFIRLFSADEFTRLHRAEDYDEDVTKLEADLARVTAERDALASEPEFRCPECGSFDVSEYHYKDDFASMECSGCRYRGKPGEDFPSATRLIAQSKENVWLREALEFYAGATSLNAVSTLLTDLGDRARKALAREASGE